MKILIYLLFAIVMATEEDKMQVRIEQGTLRGFMDKSLNGNEFFSFLGIPFAKPPVGNLRLKDPVPADPWTGVLEADKDREICTQFNMFGLMTNQFIVDGQEDCLHLNVFTPKPNDLAAKLPVMVFIHGGGFMCGSSKEYKPSVFLNEDIVFVGIQYRLGPFGFLSTGDGTMGGNYGLKDQVLALKWVQKNIANFGGDPGRVTIFGESAGGGSSHLLMLSPWSKGLFHGVIAQSGTAVCPWSITRIAKQIAQRFGDAIGCPLQDSNQYLNCIQEKDANEMMETNSKLTEWGTSPLTMLPRVDGDFLPEEPITLLKNQEYNKVNLISGITKDEGIMVIGTTLKDEKMLNELINEFDRVAPLSMMTENEKNSAKLTRRIFDHYLEGKKLNADSFSTLEDMYTDRFFSVCHDIATDLHSQDSQINTYRYQLDWQGQLSLLALLNVTSFPELVGHGDDLFYMFSGGELFSTPLERPADLKLREIFIKLWTNFAATGNPTPDDSMGFTWDPATVSDFNQLILTPEPHMSEYVNTKGRHFWESLPLAENEILMMSDCNKASKDEL